MFRHSILDPVRSPESSGLSVPLEKHLTCPICMDLFAEPVTTSCGHSFCKRCLNCNTSYNDDTCPLCKRHLVRIPEVNRVLSGLLQDLDRRRQQAKTFTLRPGEVACDACTGPLAPSVALKSCLVCLASYCQVHLEGHSQQGRLRGHRLVEPLVNLDDRACLTHGRPLELYCRESERCICALCVEDGQQVVVSVEMEWEAKKSQLMPLKEELQKRIEKRKHKLKEIRSAHKDFQDYIQNECSEVDGILSSVMSSVEEAKINALSPMNERSLAVEKQAKEVTRRFHNEIQGFRTDFSNLERIYDLEDHVEFLQTYPSTKDLEEDDKRTEMELDVAVDFGTFRSIVKNLLDDIHDKLELVTPIELQRIAKFAVDVKLDQSTAHPRLIVSTDGKEVQDSGKIRDVPENPQRFDTFTCILGQNQLTSGKAYWQVDVGEKVGWDLGVASVDAKRKGKLVIQPNTDYWVIVHYDDQDYAAMTEPPKRLVLKSKPKSVGVFLDYQGGLVSFYDLTSSSHIFSFTACLFTGELRPYFSPHNETEDTAQPLIISAV